MLTKPNYLPSLFFTDPTTGQTYDIPTISRQKCEEKIKQYCGELNKEEANWVEYMLSRGWTMRTVAEGILENRGEPGIQTDYF